MKQGMHTKVLVLILAMVVTISLIGIGAALFPILMAENDEDQCLKSLSFMDASRDYSLTHVVGLDDMAKPINNPSCPIQFVHVPYIRNKNTGEMREYIRGVVAEAMRSCWRKTGKGLLDPFPASHTSVQHCIKCTKISFDKRISEDEELKRIDNFYNYLGTHKMKLSQQSYLDYFAPESSDSIVKPLRREDIDEFPTDKELYVVWEYTVDRAALWVHIRAASVTMHLVPVRDFPSLGCEHTYS